MRTIFATLALAALLAVPGQELRAQVTFGPTAAFHDDLDFGVGGTVGARMPGSPLGVLGDFTLFFPDAADAWQINGNLTWDLPIPDRPIAPFVLGGVNVANVSPEGIDDSNTEVGINLGGGIRFSAGALEPVLGVRAEIEGSDGAVVFASLPFALGN